MEGTTRRRPHGGAGVTRRAFLSALAAAFVLDPEKLLWQPGAKLISIPKPRRFFELDGMQYFLTQGGIGTQYARYPLNLEGLITDEVEHFYSPTEGRNLLAFTEIVPVIPPRDLRPLWN